MDTEQKKLLDYFTQTTAEILNDLKFTRFPKKVIISRSCYSKLQEASQYLPFVHDDTGRKQTIGGYPYEVKDQMEDYRIVEKKIDINADDIDSLSLDKQRIEQARQSMKESGIDADQFPDEIIEAVSKAAAKAFVKTWNDRN